MFIVIIVAKIPRRKQHFSHRLMSRKPPLLLSCNSSRGGVLHVSMPRRFWHMLWNELRYLVQAPAATSQMGAVPHALVGFLFHCVLKSGEPVIALPCHTTRLMCSGHPRRLTFR